MNAHNSGVPSAPAWIVPTAMRGNSIIGASIRVSRRHTAACPKYSASHPGGIEAEVKRRIRVSIKILRRRSEMVKDDRHIAGLHTRPDLPDMHAAAWGASPRRKRRFRILNAA